MLLEGIEYKSLGTMEHSAPDVLPQRMKNRKISWSINGVDNLDKILSEKFINRLFDTIDKIYRNIIPKEVLESIDITLPLIESQTNKKDKKSNISV